MVSNALIKVTSPTQNSPQHLQSLRCPHQRQRFGASAASHCYSSVILDAYMPILSVICNEVPVKWVGFTQIYLYIHWF